MKRLLTLLLAAAMLFSCALAEASSLGLTAEVKPATEFTAQANAAVYDLPEPDVRIGRTRGWLPETIDRWNARRPGRGVGGGRPRKHKEHE